MSYDIGKSSVNYDAQCELKTQCKLNTNFKHPKSKQKSCLSDIMFAMIP